MAACLFARWVSDPQVQRARFYFTCNVVLIFYIFRKLHNYLVHNKSVGPLLIQYNVLRIDKRLAKHCCFLNTKYRKQIADVQTVIEFEVVSITN